MISFSHRLKQNAISCKVVLMISTYLSLCLRVGVVGEGLKNWRPFPCPELSMDGSMPAGSTKYSTELKPT